ncbi:deoxyribodipyrimidine photo-lyase [Solitalea koreensis]|uniref:Deoxyribodipyrimidine photo-lyase n=2 Tax=Solitalea koreensis TaxID=543615 RepID=A0A521DDD8_9SPHI|nr:deoxyribodipyrimidine photo-lyase [Solitalea koreensis]
MGLFQALSTAYPVLPIFIYDTTILHQLEDKKDRRVDYIHQALNFINFKLKIHGSKLSSFVGNPLDIFKSLSDEYDIQAVFCNRDYEPQAIQRDTEIYNFFKKLNITFKAFKDQVIFDKNDVLKNDGTPYTVYTPYSNKWKEHLKPKHYQAVPINFSNFFQQPFSGIISLKELGFEKTDMVFKQPELDKSIISEYDKYRDYPAIQGTTQLGIALRFGTISIRKCVTFAIKNNQTWLSELIWRDFFMQILYHFPDVIHQPFKKQYGNIQWRNNELEFELWCNGKTGYPLVDAGMRQLNETGCMHNRVRMIVASFLCKLLLIDWRWGEAYFAQKLNDYDLAANNGNWQWAAGCGCDAAPYFRVFNPTIQAEKFDKNLEYIKKWILEFETVEYPKPIVEYSYARTRALRVYGEALKEK